jgi:hypothetical protein
MSAPKGWALDVSGAAAGVAADGARGAAFAVDEGAAAIGAAGSAEELEAELGGGLGSGHCVHLYESEPLC